MKKKTTKQRSKVHFFSKKIKEIFWAKNKSNVDHGDLDLSQLSRKVMLKDTRQYCALTSMSLDWIGSFFKQGQWCPSFKKYAQNKKNSILQHPFESNLQPWGSFLQSYSSRWLESETFMQPPLIPYLNRSSIPYPLSKYFLQNPRTFRMDLQAKDGRCPRETCKKSVCEKYLAVKHLAEMSQDSPCQEEKIKNFHISKAQIPFSSAFTQLIPLPPTKPSFLLPAWLPKLTGHRNNFTQRAFGLKNTSIT